jgi:hypothetical protein
LRGWRADADKRLGPHFVRLRGPGRRVAAFRFTDFTGFRFTDFAGFRLDVFRFAVFFRAGAALRTNALNAATAP